MADFMDRLKTIGLLVLGAVILILHAFIFKLNQYFFTIFMCVYIIGYTALVLVLMYKYKKCFKENVKIWFEIQAFIMSAYTIFLELFLILLTFGYMFYKSK